MSLSVSEAFCDISKQFMSVNQQVTSSCISNTQIHKDLEVLSILLFSFASIDLHRWCISDAMLFLILLHDEL
jgi:hypothetical protein